jgi:hypothetical protein
MNIHHNNRRTIGSGILYKVRAEFRDLKAPRAVRELNKVMGPVGIGT